MKKTIISLFLGSLLSISIIFPIQNVSASEIVDDTDSVENQSVVPWRTWEGNYFLPDASNPPETRFFRTILYKRIYSGYLGRTQITDGLYVWYEGYLYLEGDDRPIPASMTKDEEN